MSTYLRHLIRKSYAWLTYLVIGREVPAYISIIARHSRVNNILTKTDKIKYDRNY